MGNLTCFRCVEELEQNLEANLDPVVKSRQVIILAQNTVSDTDFNSLAATCEIDFSSHQRQISKISLIQRAWKVRQAKMQKLFLQKSCLKTSYFSHSDVLATINNGVYKNLCKRSKFTYANGAIYEGESCGGFRDGYGKMKWPDLCFYEGNWSFGYPFGYGKFTYTDQDFYEGKWINPYSHGAQSISSSTQSFDLSSNASDGYIWLWFKHEGSNSLYLSLHKKLESLRKVHISVLRLLEDGRKNLINYKETCLKSKAFELDNGKYTGEMVEGKRQGVGEQVWGEGFFYIGQFVSNLQNGFGQSVWADGSIYVGFYKNSSKEGVGEYFWAFGDSYIGEWGEDVMHGVGKYVYADGREYFGQWSKGLMDGYGVFKWVDGKKYEGLWKNGKKHGQGCSYDIHGSPVFNQWYNGRLQE